MASAAISNVHMMVRRPMRFIPRSGISSSSSAGTLAPSSASPSQRLANFLLGLFGITLGGWLGYLQECDLYRQPTRGGFSTVGTIVIIHRCEPRDRSSWTDRTMPKNIDPFKLSSAGRPRYWARRQRVASRKLLVSTVCTMTSSGQARAPYQSNVN